MLHEIEEKKKTIKKARKNSSDKEELNVLDASEDSLDEAYKEIKQAYLAAQLIGTFKKVNNFVVDNQTKEDLQMQIDIFENMRKL